MWLTIKENEQSKLPSEQITHTVEVGLGLVDCAEIGDGRWQLSLLKKTNYLLVCVLLL